MTGLNKVSRIERLRPKTIEVCALLLLLSAILFFAIDPIGCSEVPFSRQIQTTRIDAVVAFASALQMVDGPFVLSLDGPRSQACTVFSQGVVDMLSRLKKLDAIDKTALQVYVAQCQLEGGGFVSTIYKAASEPNPTMLLTLYAVEILTTLSTPSPSVREATVSWVLDCYRSDGGFDEAPDRPSTFLWSTRRAVTILYLLNALDRIDSSKTAAYIRAHQNPDYGFGMFLGDSSSYLGCYDAVMALYYLGALHDISEERVVDFVMQDYDAQAGTFGSGLIDQKGHLELLGVLGAMTRINSTKMEAFVLSSQSHIHGGFVINPSHVNMSNLQHGDECSYAAKILSLLNRLDLLNAPFLVQNSPVWTGEDDLITTTTDTGNTPTFPRLPPETIILVFVAVVLGGTFGGAFLLAYLKPGSRTTKNVRIRKKRRRF